MGQEGRFLVTYTIAMICTFASDRKVLGPSAFTSIELGGKSIQSLKTPVEKSSNHVHKKLYQWLLKEAPKLEQMHADKKVVIKILDMSAESGQVECVTDGSRNEEKASVSEVCVIEYKRMNDSSWDDNIVVRRTHSTLRLLKICGVQYLRPEKMDIDIKVAKIGEDVGIDEKERNDLGTFQVGNVSICCYTC